MTAGPARICEAWSDFFRPRYQEEAGETDTWWWRWKVRKGAKKHEAGWVGEGWTVCLGLRDANMLHLEWINKVLLQSTRNCTEDPVINQWERI